MRRDGIDADGTRSSPKSGRRTCKRCGHPLQPGWSRCWRRGCWPSDLIGPAKQAIEQVKKALLDSYDQLLALDPGEEAIQYFFEAEPAFLRPLLGSTTRISSQVRLGTRFICDFASFGSRITLAQLDATLVELEPPGTRLFTRKGDPTADFTHWLRQVNDWLGWCDVHAPYLQSEFFPDSTADEHVAVTALLVVDRRESIPRDRRSVVRHMQNERLKICTYDHLRELLARDLDWHEFLIGSERLP